MSLLTFTDAKPRHQFAVRVFAHLRTLGAAYRDGLRRELHATREVSSYFWRNVGRPMLGTLAHDGASLVALGLFIGGFMTGVAALMGVRI